MSWTEFKFQRDQRVIVPNTNGIQGIIIARKEFRDAENAYEIMYLSDDLTFARAIEWECRLIAAQPHKPMRDDRRARTALINWPAIKSAAKRRGKSRRNRNRRKR